MTIYEDIRPLKAIGDAGGAKMENAAVGLTLPWSRSPTRGERNRNPGNVERSDTAWQGLAPDASPDDRYCVFTDVLYGVRVLAKVLLGYQRAHGLRTLREIVRHWAASRQADGDSYVRHCASRVGCNPDVPLELEHAVVLAALVRAVIQYENGRVACRSVINEAVRLALA
jgi:hypothetical protein